MDTRTDARANVAPAEIAKETIEILMEFTRNLQDICRDSGNFIQVIDGMETFVDAITTVKQTLRIDPNHPPQPIYQLEHELAEILRDLLLGKETGNDELVEDILAEKLPVELEKWRSQGLPAIRVIARGGNIGL